MQLLSKIRSWMNDQGGKSASAKTVAEHAVKVGTLGASLFSRDEDNRKSVKLVFISSRISSLIVTLDC